MSTTITGSSAPLPLRPTKTAFRPEAETLVPGAIPVFQRILTWFLLIPLVYLLVEGLTSFQSSGSGGYGGLAQDQEFLQTGHVSIVARLVSFVVWAICALGIATRFRRVVGLTWRMKAVSALALLTLISCIWSQDPVLTLLKSTLFIAGTLFAYYLTERFTPNELMQLLFILGVVVLLATIVVSVGFPQAGVDMTGAWRGIFSHKNKLARAILLLLPPVLALRLGGILGVVRILYVGMTIGVIVMTQSRTGWIITAAFFAFSIGVHFLGRMRKQEMLTLLLIGGALVGFLGYLVSSNLSKLTQMLGKDSTLSGRTDIWRAAIASGLKQPLLGFGFGAFWRGAQGESNNVFLSTGYALWQGHNAYLDIWLDLGFLGLGLFFITLLSACRDGYFCLRPGRPPEVDWYLSTIFVIVSLGMTQGQLLLHNNLVILLYFISCVGLHNARRQIINEEALALRGQKSLQVGKVYAAPDRA